MPRFLRTSLCIQGPAINQLYLAPLVGQHFNDLDYKAIINLIAKNHTIYLYRLISMLAFPLSFNLVYVTEVRD